MHVNLCQFPVAEADSQATSRDHEGYALDAVMVLFLWLRLLC